MTGFSTHVSLIGSLSLDVETLSANTTVLVPLLIPKVGECVREKILTSSVC